MPRFSIDGKVYSMSALNEVSLKDLVLFNTQAADMGLAERWNDVERIAGEVEGMTIEEADAHPDKLLLLGVTVWVARRLAGEDLAFGDAIDLPLSKITLLADPADKKPAKANPTKGAKAPKASVAAVAADDEAAPEEPAE